WRCCSGSSREGGAEHEQRHRLHLPRLLPGLHRQSSRPASGLAVVLRGRRHRRPVAADVPRPPLTSSCMAPVREPCSAPKDLTSTTTPTTPQKWSHVDLPRRN